MRSVSSFTDGAMAVWQRLVRFGFRLLYNELAWLYDPVSQIVSRGRWLAWQRSALPYLPESGRVLEVGSGPGHLAATLAQAGYETAAVELSRAMLRLAHRRLQRSATPASLCRGRAQALPFAPRTFDAVVVTFPTPYICEETTLGEMARVLKPGRDLVIVLEATLSERGTHARCVDSLYYLAGLRSQEPTVTGLLGSAGFRARSHTVALPGSRVSLVVGTKTG